MADQSLLPHIVAPGEAAVHGSLEGEKTHILLSGQETGGAYALILDEAPPGAGPPLHIHHNEDETFYILQGTLTVQVNEERLTLTAGMTAFLPRGIPHTYANLGAETVRYLGVVTPAGLENFFAEVTPLASETEPDMATIIALAARYKVELVGPPLAAESQRHNPMSTDKKTIVICGATGKQGGAVLNSLLASQQWRLVALTRNPDGKQAQAIKSRGVAVRRADLEDKASLIQAFAGAYAVYGVTTPLTPKGKIDTQMEWRQGRNIADACVENNVQHLVLSTVLYINEAQKAVPYVNSKQEIERYVAQNNIPYTFIRPASFMDEIGGEFLPLKNGVLTGQADGDAKVPYVACRDIGELAACAFADPQKFIGKKFNLVGDFISGDELTEVLSRVSGGKQFKHKAPPMLLMWLFAREWISLRKQFESWGRPPHPETMLQAISESRELLPHLSSFEQFLRSENHEAVF